MKLHRSLVICLFLLLSSVAAAAAKPADEELRNAVREVLRQNPELVLEVLQNNGEAVLDAAQMGNKLRVRKAMIARWSEDVKTPKKLQLEDRPFRGEASAPVAIVAYSDFTCPYCRAGEATLVQLQEKYKGKVKVYFKALPKPNDPLALSVAKYGTAAMMLDPRKGWALHDMLFAGADAVERGGENAVADMAAKAGFDFKKLKAEAAGVKVQARLDADRAEADAYGITGTPYFMVDDILVRGAVDKELFDEAVQMALRLKGVK